MNFLSNIFIYSEQSPMIFTALNFWVFFGILLFFYSFLYKNNYVRNSYLFFASLIFYYNSGGYYFSLLLFSTIVDYFVGIGIYKAKKQRKKKLLVTTSVLVNLGLLSYFKYSYFYIETINDIFGIHLEVVNILAEWTNAISGSHFDVSSIILPVGISFYTFQTISYSIDIYRGKLKPVKNIVDFGFYVSFFPQLVAGPILRAYEFIPQIYQKYSLSKQEFGHAIFLILNGLIKKVIISDFISINFVDRVFDNPLTYSGFQNLMGMYGYALQIYCDFSGYTDIAIGLALLLGFRLPVNFNSPYKAINITDFWRRWHISLSQWLKDYLYITIGGNRKGKIRTYINLAITMLLGGLWHGANLKFIIWGGLHGSALIVHKIYSKLVHGSNPNKKSKLARFISIFITFHFITFTWLFFRAKDIGIVKDMLYNIFTNFSFVSIFDTLTSYINIFALMLLGFIIHWLPAGFKEKYRGLFIQTPNYVKGIIIIVLVFVMYQVKSSELQPFIYFQF